jgi:hypothetical protein
MSSHTPSPTDDAAAAHVPPLDPLHDIDGKKTFHWVLFFTVTVFLSMWLLSIVYGYILDQEHQVKIYDRETAELNALREREAAELRRTEDLGGGRERISIDEAIRRLAK